MKYSATTGCFYPDEFDYLDIPSDCIDVSQDEYLAAMSLGASEKISVIDGKLAVVMLDAAELMPRVRMTHIARLNADCAREIGLGFLSDALGTEHLYPSQQTDQANLSANVLSSLLPSLPADWTTYQLCADGSGVWAYRAHTALQIQKVGMDGKSAILLCLTRKAARQAAVEAASTIEEIESIGVNQDA